MQTAETAGQIENLVFEIRAIRGKYTSYRKMSLTILTYCK